MSITHHFTKDQARKFCAEFGIDWHWSYTIDERDSAVLEMEKFGRYFPRVKVKDVAVYSLATVPRKKQPPGTS